MDEPTTALQAILSAGGMDAAAQSSQVIVFRRLNADDDEVHVLDLHKVKKVQDLEHDLMLEPGDMILVPKDRIAKMDRIIRADEHRSVFEPHAVGILRLMTRFRVVHYNHTGLIAGAERVLLNALPQLRDEGLQSIVLSPAGPLQSEAARSGV